MSDCGSLSLDSGIFSRPHWRQTLVLKKHSHPHIAWMKATPLQKNPNKSQPTWPMCRQFSRPTTSILLSPISYKRIINIQRIPKKFPKESENFSPNLAHLYSTTEINEVPKGGSWTVFPSGKTFINLAFEKCVRQLWFLQYTCLLLFSFSGSPWPSSLPTYLSLREWMVCSVWRYPATLF